MYTAEVCGDQVSKSLVPRSIAIPRSEEAIRSDATSAQSILPLSVFTNFSRSQHMITLCAAIGVRRYRTLYLFTGLGRSPKTGPAVIQVVLLRPSIGAVAAV